MTLQFAVRRIPAAPLALALLPATLPLLEPPPRAQESVTDKSYVDSQNRIEWPSSLGNHTFGRAVVGNYTRPGVGSVAMMYGSNVEFLFESGLHGTVVHVDSSINDVATLVGGGTGGRDALVTVSSSAPELVTYNSSDGSFDAASISAAGTDWNGALHVRCADLDQNGLQDIIGVDDDLRTIRLLSGNGSGGFTASTLFSVSNDIKDFGALDWNGWGALELGMLTTWGLEVFSSSGTLLSSTRLYQSGTSMAVLLFPGPNATDRLAGITKAPTGDNQYIVVVRNGGADTPVALGDQKVVKIGAGDTDGDGDAEVYLSHQAARTLIPFRNFAGDSATADCFDEPEGAIVLGLPGETATTNFATPLVANLGDSAGNYTIVGMQTGGFVYLNAAEMMFLPDDESGYLAVVTHPVFEHVFVDFQSCTEIQVPDENYVITVELTVQNGPDVNNPAWPSSVSGATHFEVIVWREDAANPSYPSQDSFDHAVYDFPGTLDAGDSFKFKFDLQEAECPNGGSCLAFDDRYYIELRPVTYDSVNGVTAAWRTHIAGLAGDFAGQHGSFLYLTTLEGAWSDGISWNKCPIDTGSIYGGLAPQTRVPPFNPGPPVVSPTIDQRVAASVP